MSYLHLVCDAEAAYRRLRLPVPDKLTLMTITTAQFNYEREQIERLDEQVAEFGKLVADELDNTTYNNGELKLTYDDRKAYLHIDRHYHNRERGVRLVRLYVLEKYRRQGIATTIMEAVCLVADRMQIELYGAASPFQLAWNGVIEREAEDRPDTATLLRWYQDKFGFEEFYFPDLADRIWIKRCPTIRDETGD